MADKKAKAAKAKVQDFSSMGAAELQKEIRVASDKRARLTFQHGVTPLKSPIELRNMRRELARMKTQLRMKEAAK